MPASTTTEDRLRQALNVLTQMQKKLESLQTERFEPIAVVGVGCRFPGGADSPDALWQLLDQGVDAVQLVPEQRWDRDAIFDEDRTKEGKTYTRHGGFVERPDCFDPLPFNISPREATHIDPQHRLLLEASWEALERAGLSVSQLRGSSTGVFVGIGPSDYEQLQKGAGLEALDTYTGMGSGSCFAAGRLSYILGLRGPAVSLDTACSSSLVALHLACQSLRLQECDQAIAGGVNLMLSPLGHVLLARTRALSPDGRCKAFSDKADGYGRGEGCGVLVLKRQADAVAAGDPIVGLVLGSSVRHDGASSGLTVPNGQAQEEVLRAALKAARVTADSVDFVEAHGTGTPLGDPIEIEALAAVYGEGRSRPLTIGSVKSNLGHLESAAGMAGVIKALLALQHERIPAHLHGAPASRLVEWEQLPLEVSHQARSWPRGETPRRAGVSAFGFSGTNAHVVLQEAPSRPCSSQPAETDAPTAPQLFPISACSATALRLRLQQLQHHLQTDHPSLAALSQVLTHQRSHFEQRAAFVAQDEAGLQHQLAQWLEQPPPARTIKKPRIAMLFSGQGSQSLGMAKRLAETIPFFDDELRRIARLFDGQLDRSLLDVMWGADAATLNNTAYAQPALFAMEMALFSLWRHWGVEADVVLGHSVGEIAAACAAGVMQLRDGAALIATRGRMMGALPTGGAMLAVRADAAFVERLLADSEHQRLSMAAFNGDMQVVSGAEVDIERLRASLKQRAVATVRLQVSHAFHSSLMEPMLQPFSEAIAAIPLSTPQLPLISNLSGDLADQEMSVGDYWVQHIRRPVQFQPSVQTLANQNIDVVIELGPHPVLLGMAASSWPAGAGKPEMVPSLRRGKDDRATVFNALATLYRHGVKVAWPALSVPGWQHVAASLPSYPFERQRLWLDDLARATLPQRANVAEDHNKWLPLAGAALNLPGKVIQRALPVSLQQQPYLADHVVHGRVVVPGAFLLAVLLTVAAEPLDAERVTLSAVQFMRPLIVDKATELFITLTPAASANEFMFELATPDPAGGFRIHAGGEMTLDAAPPRRSLAQIQSADAATGLSVDRLHEELERIHIDWGLSWRWLSQLEVDGDHTVGRLTPKGSDAEGVVHPTRLDMGFATVFAALLAADETADATPHLPYGLESLRWYRNARGSGQWRASIISGTRDSEVVVADLRLLDAAGRSVIEIDGFTGKRARRQAFLGLGGAEAQPPLWRPEWQPVTLERAQPKVANVLFVGAELARLTAPLSQCAAQVSSIGFDDISEHNFAEHDLVIAVFAGDETDDLPMCVRKRLEGAIELTQRLVFAPNHPELLWLIRGGEGSELMNAALLGLGRSVMQEQPTLQLRMVDVGCADDAIASEGLFARTEEPQLRWRDKWLAPRLRRSREDSASWKVAPQKSIIVTGGLGALGRPLVRWLVAEKGARQLQLLSRSGVTSPQQQALLDEVREQGASVTVEKVDVADASAVSAWWQQHAEHHQVQGIIHAAGVLQDGVVTEQTSDKLARVLAPKVAGTWNLHRLAGDDLSFMVLFSSTASLVGPPGQSGYAAANAFMDELAQCRRRAGKHAVSVSWGLWQPLGDDGMASALDEAALKRLQRLGHRTISNAEGMSWLESVVSSDAAHVALWPFDPPASLPTPMRQLLGGKQRMPRAAKAFREEFAASEDRRAYLIREVSTEATRVLALGSAEAVPRDNPLHEVGLDSLLAVELRNGLAALTGESLPATLLFDYPTVIALAEQLLELLDDVATVNQRSQTMRHKVATAADADEPIAIVGVACRLPGGVNDPEAFWKLLDSGGDAIAEVPSERWDVADLYDPNPAAVGKMSTKRGGFLEDVYHFDPEFFGIPKEEAEAMDPQHRLLLETSWEALERSGNRADKLMGSATGVFLGLMSYDYQILHGLKLKRFDGYVGTGNAASVASGRISYLLGLRGPSLTLDTACSSSLVATHLAAQSLRSGECDLALCGGATLILSPGLFVEFSRLRGMASDGRCKPFGASADGVGWSEGCVTLVLKRAGDAERDGDRILGLLRGSAVNQDGRSQGLTAPNGPAQQAVIERALSSAGITADQLDYVETHGTGTPLGDPIEAQALSAVVKRAGRNGSHGSPSRRLPIGSVKSNLGHTQAAAGGASMIKSLLALQHQRIPASLHTTELNPQLQWDTLALQVAQQPVKLPRRTGQPRIVGVSSFGISGTNAHVLLQEAPEPDMPRPPAKGEPQMVALSAASSEGLRRHAQSWARYLSHHDHALADIAFTALCRRSELKQRACVQARSNAELVEALTQLAEGQPHAGAVAGQAHRGKLMCAFSTEGDWHDMVREWLGGDASFRSAVEEAIVLFERHVDWPLRDWIHGSEDAATISEQQRRAVLFLFMIGQSARWRNYGVEPDGAMGRGVGELAAAVVCGVLTLESAICLLLKSELPAQPSRPSGQPRKQLHVYRNDEWQKHVEQDSFVWMPSTADEFTELRLEVDSTPLLSFQQDGYRRVLKIGGKKALAVSLVGIEATNDNAITVVAGLQREESASVGVLRVLASLWVSGQPLDEDALHPQHGQVVPLPAQPFARKRYAITAGERYLVGASDETSSGHPLLGVELSLANASSNRYWQNNITLSRLPYLHDHQVGAAVVMPAAATLEIFRAAASDAFGEGPLQLVDVRFDDALVLAENATEELQLCWRDLDGHHAEASLSSRRAGEWSTKARAELQRGRATPPAAISVELLQKRCERRVASNTFYDRAAAAGLSYGPTFRRLLELQLGTDECVASIRLDDNDDAYGWHPAVLDACLQCIAVLDMENDDAQLAVPVAVASIQLWEAPANNAPIYCHVQRVAATTSPTFTLAIYDERGNPLAKLNELQTQALDATADGVDDDASDIFSMVWREASAPQLGTAMRVGLLGAEAPQTALLVEALRSLGAEPALLADDDLESYVDEGPAVIACVHGLSMPDWGCDPLSANARGGWYGALTATQRLAKLETRHPPRLWLVTRGAHYAAPSDIPDPLQASAWGLGRTLALECASLQPSLVDVPSEPGREDYLALARELLSNEDEDQVSLRGDIRLLARLKHGEDEPQRVEQPPTAAGDRPYRLHSHPSRLLDKMVAEVMTIPHPAADEVLIEVAAAGLNFRDVLMAMGALPGIDESVPLGGECTGIVKSVGESVSMFRPGDRVLAVARGAFASHVVASELHVVPLPTSLEFEDGAGVAVIFATVWHALKNVARLEAGQFILVHAGAGGTGQAALQLARSLGARVIASAGTDVKRRWLSEQGVELVVDSRSLLFREQVLAHTEGHGVEVVLNSLAGAAVDAGLDCLAEHGHFVELGIRDIRSGGALALRAFDKGISFTAINLANMIDRSPERLQALLREVMAAFERGQLFPIATTVEPLAAAADVMADMAAARHQGKLVFRIGSADTPVVSRQPRAVALRSGSGSYLVTGGLGALGLSAAEALVEAGARNLVLVGRRGITNQQQRQAIAALSDAGAKVTVAAADVADRAQLAEVIAALPREQPLRGVIHAAGVLDDATIDGQNEARFLTVMKPKLLGAWHLDQLTADAALDFFVLYSSASAMLGAAGQSNYAAANAFMDALAARRRLTGRVGLSIGWGAFSGSGLAKDQADAMAHRGMGSWTLKQGNELLLMLLSRPLSHAGVFRLRPKQWLSFHPELAGAPWLSELAAEHTDIRAKGGGELREQLSQLSESARHPQLLSWLRDIVAGLLRCNSEDVLLDEPLNAQGIDSLRGIELRNRLENGFAQRFSATLVWAHPTIEKLATHIASLVAPEPIEQTLLDGIDLDQVDASLAAEVEAMSDAEVAHLLAEALRD